MNSSIRWPDQTLPAAVYCAVEALADLEKTVREGLQALPRTGLGVGGLLVGTRESRSARVSGLLEIPCSYALGPSFILTPDELAAARGLAQEATDGSGNVVVGWYRSKTTGPLAMTDHDRTLFDELCPEPWQLALLIKPIKAAPTTAVFAFRDSGEKATGGFRLGEPVEMPLQAVGDEDAVPPGAADAPEVAASNSVPEPSESIPPSAVESTTTTGAEGAPPVYVEGGTPAAVQGSTPSAVESTATTAAEGAPPAAVESGTMSAAAGAPPAAAEDSEVKTEAASPPVNTEPVRISMPYTGTLFGLPAAEQKGSSEKKCGRRSLIVALIVLAALGLAVLIAGYLNGWFGIPPH